MTDTVESVLAEMRKAQAAYRGQHASGTFRRLADRLAAAHAREVGKLRASRDAYKHDAEALLAITKATERDLARAEAAEGLLRECVDNREGLAYEHELLARIDAHLSGKGVDKP